MPQICRLITLAIVCTAPGVHAEDGVALDFDEAPLASIVESIAQASRERILHPMRPEEVAGWEKATASFTGEVAAGDLVATCQQILGTRGYSLVPAGGEQLRVWCVVPTEHAEARSHPHPEPGELTGAGVGDTVPMDFDGVSVRYILDAVADLTGRTFSWDPRTLRQTCTFSCPRQVPVSGVLAMFRIILEQAGMAMVSVGPPSGDFEILKIVPESELLMEAELVPRRAAALGWDNPGGGQVGEAPGRTAPSSLGRFTITRAVADDIWEVSEADTVDLVQNQVAYMDEVNFRAYYDPRTRTQMGLQLRSKVPEPRFARFGLINRDVLTKVAGEDLTSAGQIGELIEAHKDDDSIEIELVRRGREVTMTYRLRHVGEFSPPTATVEENAIDESLDWFKATRPIAANVWELGEADTLDLLDNYAEYLDEVNLRAYYDPRSRTLLGLQVRSKVPSPKFAKFGMRNRDVLTKVAGEEITSASQINGLISRHRDDEQIVIDLLRQNKPMTLTYHMRPAGSPAAPRGGSGSRHGKGGPAVGTPGSVPMDFDGVEAMYVIDAVHSLLGVTFVAGDSLDHSAFGKCEVFLRAPENVPIAHLLLALQVMLEQNGCSLARERTIAGAPVYRIVPVEGLVPPGSRMTVWPGRVRATATARVTIARPPEETPDATPEVAAGAPGTISVGLPASAKVGETFHATVTIDAGIRHLAAYGIEFKWDQSILAISNVGPGDGSFDAPFVINLENDKGELRFNGISVQPTSTGKVPVATLAITVLAAPSTGTITIDPASFNQTVAIYDADGRTPVVVPNATVEPATMKIE